MNLLKSLKKIVRLDEAGITTALRGFGEFRSPHLMVHSSLSACGHIVGGPKTVIRSLRNWICPSVTLVMPTHTYCYPDPSGLTPVYDAAATPSRVGLITEIFRHEPNVTRSIHPTHSLCAQGPDSEMICRGHELCDTPCGKGTPYERLVQNDAAVLMFGVNMNTYTFFHTAEDAASAPYLYESKDYLLRYRKNELEQTMKMRRQDMGVTRRFSEMDRWLEKKGLLVRSRLGLGEIFFIEHTKQVHEALIAALQEDPYFLVNDSMKRTLK